MVSALIVDESNGCNWKYRPIATDSNVVIQSPVFLVCCTHRGKRVSLLIHEISINGGLALCPSHLQRFNLPTTWQST